VKDDVHAFDWRFRLLPLDEVGFDKLAVRVHIFLFPTYEAISTYDLVSLVKEAIG
jgi:hypothetical protein